LQEFSAPLDPDLRAQVFASVIGDAPPSAAAELRTYFLDVHRCCVRWLEANADVSAARPTAFVLSERLDLDEVFENNAQTFVPLGRLDGPALPSAFGSIVLTSRNIRLAYSRGAPNDTVIGIVEELRRLGLGGRPTAIFVPGEKTLSFFNNGVDNRPTVAANAGALAKLDPANLLSLIEYFHENWTRYPDGLGACWDNAGNRIVERNAERNIRNHLFVFLSMVVYRTDYIAREHQLPNGRVDIFLYGLAVDDPEKHRVIELKVLRSRSIGWKGKGRSYSDDVNKRYVEKGLRQARRYRTATNALAAYLFCFDARLEDAHIEVDAYAASLEVTWRRFFMESSAHES
jgi:hypothetical protein